MRHPKVGRGRVSFGFEPYRLVVYKEGLYFVGYSLYHNSVRTFLFDDCREVETGRGRRFEAPPIELSLDRKFGLFGGPSTSVRLWFSRQVARLVTRRRWHPSQEIVELDDGVELHMTVDGTTELLSWILGFGGEVEVLDPATLRAEVAREQRRGFERNRPSSSRS
jgi:proteasome accessory factor B